MLLITTNGNKLKKASKYVGSSCTLLVFNQLPRLTQPGHPSGADRMSTSKSSGVNSTPCNALGLWSHR